MINPYQLQYKEDLLSIFRLNIPDFFNETEIGDFEYYLEHNSDTYLIIEEDHQVIGGAGYYVNKSDNSGRITWIFIDPQHAGQGYGTQAVEYCLKELRDNLKVEKFVVTTSQKSFKFFAKFGFQVVHTQKDYWGEGLDLYEMKLFAL